MDGLSFPRRMAVLAAVVLSLISSPAWAAAVPSGSPGYLASHDVAIPFLPNQGQLDARVAFYAPLFAGTVFLTRDGEIVYSLPAAKSAMGNLHAETGWVLVEHLLASSRLKPTAGEAAAEHVDYLIGRDPSHWQHGLPSYDSVSLGQPWPGIEVSLTAHADHVETFYNLAAGADVRRIHLKVSGAKALKIEDGRLVAETGVGPVTFEEPKAWQNIGGTRRPVAVRYALHGHGYGFRLGTHDASAPVVIDPTIQATYLGGSGNGNDIDSVHAMSLAPNGDIYVAGQTTATDFPGTAGGAPAGMPAGGFATAFVARLDPTLSTLRQATYLGGTKQLDDYALAIAIDAGGDVYIAGITACTDFPVTTGAAQTGFGGGLNDGFVAKLSADLRTLDQATYLGGTGDDYAYGIAIGSGGDVYVAGTTSSTDFPSTSGGAQASAGGSDDAFVAKLDTGLTAVEQSTYLGGSGYDSARAIALDASGDIYIAGSTASSDLPGTSGGAQSAIGVSTVGNPNAFVAKLDPSLTNLDQATYLGGSSAAPGPGVFGDWANAIAIGPSGNVYVTGQTPSADFPGTTGGAQSQLDSTQDAFVAKFTGDLSTLDQATYLGGSGLDFGVALGFDSSGNVLVGGYTYSDDLPGTSGGSQPSRQGLPNGFVAKLTPDLGTLDQASYLGGSGGDFILALTIDSSGDIYVAGQTGSRDFPGTAGGAQASYGYADVTGFIAKLPADFKAQAKITLGFLAGTPPGANKIYLNPGDFDIISVTVSDLSTDTDVSGITYTITLPSNLSLQYTQPEFGTCIPSGQVITCSTTRDEIDLAPGIGYTNLLEVQAASAGPATIAAAVTQVDQDLAAGSVTSAQLGVIVVGATTANSGNVSTPADQTVSGSLSGSNPCGCGTLIYKVDAAASHGNVSITNATTGTFTYTPAIGYVGADSFGFELDNGLGSATPATIQVTVTDITPTTNGGNASTKPNTAVTGTAAATAGYDGQALTYRVVMQPSHGTVTISSNGQFRYIPAADFAGSDSFTFKVTDSAATDSNVSTEGVTVTDQAAAALPSSFRMPHNSSHMGTLTATRAYNGQQLTYAVVKQPLHGTLTLDAATGKFTYTAKRLFRGADSFTFKVTDQFGTPSKVAAVTIVVY